MLYAAAYAAILLPFCLLDAVWLTVMGKVLYKPTLGDILLPGVNLPPAIAFYLIYPIGILVFAVLPALLFASGRLLRRGLRHALALDDMMLGPQRRSTRGSLILG